MTEKATKPRAVYKDRMARYPDERWLIWSNKWQSWYAPNSRGYTKFVERAGIYSRDEATEHYAPELPRSWRDTEPFPLSAVKPQIRKRIQSLTETAMECERAAQQLSRLLQSQERIGPQ